MKELFKYAFILGLICFLSSSVLAVVNGITESHILMQKVKAEDLALRQIMGEEFHFKPHYIDEKIDYYKAYNSQDQSLAGFVLKVQAKGFNSQIEILTALNLNLEVSQVKILSQNETPGLGTRITEGNFLERFKNRGLEDLNRVEAITGATISSGAVIKAIKGNLAGLKEELEGEAKGAS